MKHAIFAALLTAAFCAHAEKAVIIGHGSTQCGDWLRVERSDAVADMANKIGMSQWVMGYLSAVNAGRIERNRETYDLPTYNSITAFMTKACGDNPIQNLYQVAIQLQLAIRRQEQSMGRGKD